MTVPHVPVATVRASHRRLQALAGQLSEADVRAPSRLPGWSRAHVLAHLAANARAFARMTREALHGRVVPLYDGGAEGRDAEIAAEAQRPAGELAAALAAGNVELEQAWGRVGPEDWDRPVSFWDATLAATVDGRWRESEIHAVDLDAGADVPGWSPDFCAHALDFLLQRLPAGTGASLVPLDDEREWVVGAGDGPRVTGRLCDLTAWLAGRDPAGPVQAEGGGLPPLDPWPSPLPRPT